MDWPISSSISLPVELTLFHALLLPNQTTQLDWQTASELNNRGFDIERSLDGRNWQAIGFVEGHGTTNITQNYRHIDPAPNLGINYYRLRQLDLDGKYEYSYIRSVVLEGGSGNSVQIYPNPVSDGLLNVNFVAELEGTATLRIFDANGRLLHRETLSNQHNQTDHGKLPAGIYFIEITGDNNVWRERLVVAK